MSSNPYAAYLETQVLSASPLELIHLAYEGAIKAIVDAREHLAAGRIQDRTRAITKALDLLMELARGLNFEQGGDLSVQLARLYDYMQRRLAEANAKQIAEPLAEVQSLLENLDEAWKTISMADTGMAVAAASSPWVSTSDSAVYSRADFTL
jgi:flagellar secretion chaperone FliS